MIEVMWRELELAQLSYPTLSMDDQTSWLVAERTMQLPKMPQGHFNIRLTASPIHGPAAHELLCGRFKFARHRAYGRRTHLLHANTVGPTGSGMIEHLFLIDLRKALLRGALAEMKIAKEGWNYLHFDPDKPGTEAIYERLRVA